jgi:glyoxylase-like metal-dependent hydrolase (beta-lactamase superfamily II)
MDVRELAPGLWRWSLPHPDWTPEEGADDGWDEVVACYAVESEGGLVLFDPLAPPPGTADAEEFWRALDRDVDRLGAPAVLLTIFWHARSAREILRRYEDATVWAHEPAAELVSERTPITETFSVGDVLPGGATPIDAHRAHEVLFWLPSHRALAAGDVLLGRDGGGARLCPASWLGEGIEREELKRALAPLLELPLERLLLMHGEAILGGARHELARALAEEA